MEILREIEQGSFFELAVFDGKLFLRGRILTVSEVEQLGMGSSLIAHQILSQNKQGVSSLDIIREKASNDGLESLNDTELNRMIDFISSIRPEQLDKWNEDQDKILCRVIKEASEDGKNWQNFTFVTAIEQQNASENKLWTGMLSREDREALLQKAMNGQQEAVKRVKSFQK